MHAGRGLKRKGMKENACLKGILLGDFTFCFNVLMPVRPGRIWLYISQHKLVFMSMSSLKGVISPTGNEFLAHPLNPSSLVTCILS